MFVNGVLCNSESWHDITEKDIEELEVLNRSLIKYIIGLYPKVQNEFLYLETRLMPRKILLSPRAKRGGFFIFDTLRFLLQDR